MNEIEKKLFFVLHECNQHNKRMLSAIGKMSSYMPLDMERYNSLSEDEIEHIDQYLFRFSKLQDTIGEKLFPTLLTLLNEKVKNKPFIDILNRLEELELIEREEWIRLRVIRNSVAHEYPFEKEEIVENLNNIYECFGQLKDIFKKIFQFCLGRFEFIKKDKFEKI